MGLPLHSEGREEGRLGSGVVLGWTCRVSPQQSRQNQALRRKLAGTHQASALWLVLYETGLPASPFIFSTILKGRILAPISQRRKLMLQEVKCLA